MAGMDRHNDGMPHRQETVREALIVANPTARNGRAEAMVPVAADILRGHGWSVDVEITRSAEHASEIGAAGSPDGPVLVALGGDGLVAGVAEHEDVEPPAGVQARDAGVDLRQALQVHVQHGHPPRVRGVARPQRLDEPVTDHAVADDDCCLGGVTHAGTAAFSPSTAGVERVSRVGRRRKTNQVTTAHTT